MAPFVGLDGYLGWAGFEDRALDGVDNDNDGFVDELDEESDFAFVAAVAPEVGVHFWLSSQWRLTGSADYRVTTDGRATDALFYGLTLAWLPSGQRSPPKDHASVGGEWTFGAEDHPDFAAVLPDVSEAVAQSAGPPAPREGGGSRRQGRICIRPKRFALDI